MTMSADQVAGRLLDHLKRDTSDMAAGMIRVPTTHYFDEEHAEAEREVFRSHPLVVGHSTVLADAGSFVTLELLGIPLLLVRKEDGKVAGFRNICRHRGGRVESDISGSRRVFTCRYHGWSYDRDGSLRNIPFEEGFTDIDKSCSGLVAVGAEDRHGLLWVQLNSTGDIDVADHLGPEFDDLLRNLALGTMQVQIEERFEEPVNWKLIAEGNLDVLHPKFLHPDSVGKLIQSRTHVWEPYGKHARHAMARSSLAKVAGAIGPDADIRAYVITSYFVYPNTWLNVQPSHFEWWTILPNSVSATATSIVIRYLAPLNPTEAEQRSIDKSWEILKDIVPTEDWQMARWIQAGAAHTGTDTFVYGANETPVQHLHESLFTDMA